MRVRANSVGYASQSYTAARTMAERDLIVLGDCNPDLLLRGNVVPAFGQVEQIVDEASFEIGGSGAIVAAGAARLGLRCGLVSVVGDDALGRLQLDALSQRGVDVSTVVVDKSLSTGLTVILSRGDDRAILTFVGAIDGLDARLIDTAVLRSARHVHISSYYLQRKLRATLEPLLGAVREGGASVSLDPNWDPDETWDGGLLALLPLLDYLFVNEQEARLIGREDDPVDAARTLASKGPTVVVKLGALGGLLVSGADMIRAPALSRAVVDTSGAGDSFDAGFLCGLLAGWEPARCLELACVCGSLSVSLAGLDGQPTLDEALRACA
jgi:sugar/nucleoside kinase (ribokinase family)